MTNQQEDNDIGHYFEIVVDNNSEVPSMTICPTVKSAPFAARTLQFHKGPVYIGRTNGLFQLGDDLIPSTTNCIFDEPTVSRRHAVMTFEEGCFWIQDLQSTHGTKINDVRLGLERVKLRNGDILSIGAAGWEEEKEFKAVVGLINLNFPLFGSIVPNSVDQYPAKEKEEEKKWLDSIVADSRGDKDECSMQGENVVDTQTMDELIAHLEKEKSPRAKRKLEAVKEAKSYKDLFGISNKEAVDMVPILKEF